MTYHATSDACLMLPPASMPEPLETPQRGSLEGAITETLALAKLLEMGLYVARPVVDNGADLLVYEDGRCLTIQVKGSRGRITEPVPGYRYQHFNYGTNPNRGWSCDVNLLYAEPLDVWWVLPGHVIRQRGIKTNIGIYPEPKAVPKKTSDWVEPYREAWDLIPGLLAHAETPQQAFELVS